MFEDIETKNQLDFHTSIQDLSNGKKYEIKTDKMFFIGKGKLSNILISEPYISKIHSIINFENDKFVFYNKNNDPGAYINYFNILDKKIVLKDGDIISYTENLNYWKYIYMFNTSLNTKQCSVYKNCIAENNTFNEKYKESLKKFQTQALKLKIDQKKLYEEAMSQIDEFKNIFNTVEYNNNINKQSIKLNSTIQILNNKVTELIKQIQEQQRILVTESEYHRKTTKVIVCLEGLIQAKVDISKQVFR